MQAEGCYKSAIVGHNGVTWAHTGGFRIREEEVAHVLEILKEDDMHELQSGFNVAGKPFAFIRGEFNYDDDYELTWFVGRHKRRGKLSEGVLIIVTERTVIFGVHNAAFTSKCFGNALLKTSRMAQGMVQKGF
ncbi:hypothetical protein NDN08_003473 [Rhodosorus marinus]|uniref:Profilin n=1 Tax=Rhodosorus marinus TaxID=101924 RepID=A0AAV8UWK6_9RHOD|nr:hypothetical protein NDN08_003473 [Rhodosorus marinus]